MNDKKHYGKIISAQEVEEKLASGEYIEVDGKIYVKEIYERNQEEEQ